MVLQADRVHEDELPQPENCVILTSTNTYKSFAKLCSALQDHPGKELRMIGVTGTNGKTTITHLIETILKAQKQSVGLIGTLGSRDASSSDTSYKTSGHTTPMADELQRRLTSMRSAGNEWVVMEVSSHALAQYRTEGCEFELAVFSNLTQDHLDYHKTMDRYFSAKALLFATLNPELEPRRCGIINFDDPYAERLQAGIPEGVKVFGYSIHHPDAEIRATEIEYTHQGARYWLITPKGARSVQLRMTGEFSVYNSLAAIASALALKIDLNEAVDALEQAQGVPGRFEVVTTEPFSLVDYAHTPDGLENILEAARTITPEDSRLFVVFGCGGDRDATKRPKMGRIAERLADCLIITSDNPRTESPQQILTDIITGIERFEPDTMRVLEDRREAIELALQWASPNDVVVVAGKGHEDYQILADRTIHFDDKEELLKAHEKLKSGSLSG